MKLLFGIVLFATSFAALAVDQSSGCGLGWYVMTKNTLVSSSLRATTNGLFFNQTFGMTSGTSNCAKHDIIMNEKKAIHFAEANATPLMIDMSRGHGEYLNGFADVVGYKGDMNLFGDIVRTHFTRIYPTTTTTPQMVVDHFKGLFI